MLVISKLLFLFNFSEYLLIFMEEFNLLFELFLDNFLFYSLNFSFNFIGFFFFKQFYLFKLKF
jgi:hypothetical protein